MKSSHKNFIYLLTITLLTVLFSITLQIVGKDLKTVEETHDVLHEEYYEWNNETQTGEIIVHDYEFGKSIAGYRITDIIDDANLLTKVNYVPDVFLEATLPIKDGIIVDLTDQNFHFAKRGTLQFIILGPNPKSETYNEDIAKIERFKRGDYWHFTLQIPPIFTASNIYYGAKCVASYGAIKDYEYIDHSTTDNRISKDHHSLTNITDINLSFYTQRNSMDPGYIPVNSIITIHYESENAVTRPLNTAPVIGMNEKVIMHQSHNSQAQIIFCVFNGIIISIFLFISLLKREFNLIPLIISLFGIFLSSLAYILLEGRATTPTFFVILRLLSPVITLSCAIIYILQGLKQMKVVKILFPISLAILGIIFILTCILPVFSYEVLKNLKFFIIIFLLLNGVLLLFFSYYGILFKKKKLEFAINPVLISISICFFLISNRISFVFLDPVFYILSLIMITTAIILVRSFIAMEKENVYLTNNLEKEIAIQTKELTKVLNDRNTLIQFVSHDLKKPIAFYTNNLNKLRNSNTSKFDSDLIDSLIMKGKEVTESLNKISEFSHLNFLNEKTEAIDLNQLFAEVYESILPDCDASGVHLNIDKMPKQAFVFGKVAGLKTSILNILFNALEHAHCNNITLTLKKVHQDFLIGIKNDGRKIDENLKIFEPYISEFKEGTHGLGLYIVRQAIDAMNGEIYYESNDLETTFFIRLPIFES